MNSTNYITHRLTLDPRSTIKFSHIYDDYQRAAHSQGLVPVGSKVFSRELRKFYEEHQAAGRVLFLNRSGLVVRGVALT